MPTAQPADVINSATPSRFGLWPAWIALVCSLALTVVAWRYTQQDLDRRMRAEFDAGVSQMRADIDAGIAGYMRTLRGAAALFAASDKVTREDWHGYVAGLRLETDYPAMQALIFARAVTGEELGALVREVRKSGIADYAVRPPGRRERHVVSVYAEPYVGLNVQALGRDIFQDPARREAMERARNADQPVITGKVRLLMDGHNPVPSFAMMLPVPSKSGGEVFGYVLSPFRMPVLMADLLKRSPRDVSLSIHDGIDPRPENLFYRSDTKERPSAAKFVHSETLVVGGRPWTLSYASMPELEVRGDMGRSTQVLAGGLLTSVLLFAIAWSLATTRDRAVRLARVMTGSLRESEARFRTLVEQAPDAIVVHDVDLGCFVDANAQAEKLFGCSREELLKAGPERFYPPEQFNGKTAAESVREMIDRALAGEQVSIERTVCNARGAIMRCEVRLARLPSADRRLIRGSFLDITERLLAEDVRRRAEQRDVIIFRTSPSAVSIARAADGRLVEANDALARLLGHSQDEMLGRTSLEVGFWPSTEACERWLEALQREGELHEHEVVLCDAGGAQHIILMSSSFIEFAGEPCIVSFFHDVTERKLTEQSLRIAAITFESQEGMMITDAQKVMLRVNHAFSEITGYGSEEAVGRTPRLLSSGRHEAAFYDAMWESVEKNGTWRGEIWNRRKDGEIYPEWLSVTAVKASDGTITHYVGTFSDITLRKAAEDEIRNLAFYDPLTQLPNRRLMLDRLRQALTSSARHGRHGALMLFDLDDFKTLNDTLGHDVGDQFLVEVGRRMESCIREGDTVARLGGDEFVVILEDLDAETLAAMQAESIAVKIQAALSRPYVLDLSLAGVERDTRSYHCTSSIGITLFRDQSVSVEELMKRADTAMYQAKAAGRNTMRFYDPAMQAVVAVRAEMNADMRNAVREGQFLLHYQPQVDGAGRVTGAEALVRWRHPRRGLVAPGEFIPLAEDNGLILPLGRWVLKAACNQLLEWAQRAEMAHLTVAVNVSSRQFRQRDFVEDVLSVIQETGANPHKLKLELTESLLLHDMEDIIAKMTALKAEGVSFSLDDFGTGYSSLSYLKRLPLGQLKIDQSFVRDVLTDSNDAAIARTIIALGQSLGMKVIAEGVETEGQREFLASEGCHAYQGYLFGRPGTAEALQESALQIIV
jgi:diguanylate cyclase (GGDEF)-like protein/PAS domain S-box-containing protein